MREVVYESKVRTDDQRCLVQFLGLFSMGERFVDAPKRDKQVRVPLMGLSRFGVELKRLSELSLRLRPIPIAPEQRIRQRDVSLSQRVVDLKGLTRFGLCLWKRLHRSARSVSRKHVVAVGESSV